MPPGRAAVHCGNRTDEAITVCRGSTCHHVAKTMEVGPGYLTMTADILPFLKDRAFDAEATRVMGEAYDKARKALHDRGQPHLVQEIIAERIIDIAAKGERNPDELARRALQALGLTTEQP